MPKIEYGGKFLQKTRQFLALREASLFTNIWTDRQTITKRDKIMLEIKMHTGKNRMRKLMMPTPS
jgi:hypothetical protein